MNNFEGAINVLNKNNIDIINWQNLNEGINEVIHTY